VETYQWTILPDQASLHAPRALERRNFILSVTACQSEWDNQGGKAAMDAGSWRWGQQMKRNEKE